MRVMKTFLFFCLLVLSAHNASACSCMPLSFEDKVANSGAIFSGTVMEVTGASGGRCGPKTATVKVNKAWKGDIPETLEMQVSDGCVGCGMYLTNGVTYLFYGGASMCSGSRPINHVQEDVSKLDAYFSEVSGLDAAIKQHPDAVAPKLAKTDYFLRKGDYTSAQSSLESLKDNREALADSHYWSALGQALLGLEEYKGAAEALQTSLKLKPGQKDVKGKWQEAQMRAGVPMTEIFPDKDGRLLKLAGKRLENISFRGMDLRKVDFSGAQLREVDFSEANLELAVFTGAELGKVNFTGAKFSGVELTNAGFYDVTFDHTKLGSTVLGRARLYNVTLRNMTFDTVPQGLGRFENAVWENIALKNIDASGLTITGALKNVRFINANLTSFSAFNSQLENVRFENSNLTDARLHNSDLKGTVFIKSNLKTAKFFQSYLDRGVFKDTDLTEASFYAASLKGATFDNVVMTPNMSSTGTDALGYVGYEHHAEHNNRSGNTNPGKTNFYMAVYDCDTVWPKDMMPSKAGAVLTDARCRDRKNPPLDMHGGTIGTFNYDDNKANIGVTPSMESADKGRKDDFSGGIFRNANMRDMILRGTIFDNADLTGADLTGTELRNSSLKGADFSGARMDGVSLKLSVYDCKTKWPEGFDYAAAGAMSSDAACGGGADLRGMSFNRAERPGAVLQRANLEGVDFLFANLQNADLSGANLAWANVNEARLDGATLTGADFSNARLSGTSFENSNLRNAILTDTLMDGINLTGVDMRGTDHTGRKMRRAKLEDANFEGVRFDHANLAGTEFAGADLSGASFKGANLSAALLQNPHYSYVSTNFGEGRKEDNYKTTPPKPAKLEHADFSDADLSFSYLGDVDLSTAKLDGANLTLAKFGCGAKWPEGFNPTKAGAVLEEPCENVAYEPTDLEGRDLSGKRIGLFDFNNANLTKADLSRAELSGVDFSHAVMDGVRMYLARYECSSTRFPEGFDPGKLGAMSVDGDCDDKHYSPPNFVNQSLANENFSYLSLQKVNFSGADLRQASFERSDLSGANLSGAKLQGANLYSVTLHEANLTGAEYDCATKWSNGTPPEGMGLVNMEGSCNNQQQQKMTGLIRGLGISPPQERKAPTKDFSGQDLRGEEFSDMNLGGANFSGSKLDWATFRHTPLHQANFSHASLRGAEFNTSLIEVNFEGADLTNVQMNTAGIGNLNLRHAILKNVRFGDRSGIESMDLTGVRYDCRTFWGWVLQDGTKPEDFDPRAKGAILEDDGPCRSPE